MQIIMKLIMQFSVQLYSLLCSYYTVYHTISDVRFIYSIQLELYYKICSDKTSIQKLYPGPRGYSAHKIIFEIEQLSKLNCYLSIDCMIDDLIYFEYLHIFLFLGFPFCQQIFSLLFICLFSSIYLSFLFYLFVFSLLYLLNILFIYFHLFFLINIYLIYFFKKSIVKKISN